ncbi:hypothetical protein SELMODRAFT_424637 [Selaginella moellendorffii]|uniref:Remorin C-terminal domain-containing protein n=1 Tax=Selaginella moellendorffii TaxID=88036 RepID=D8SQK2_SELML|nr:hypothetical protein SELMODRAFT_424637 [Selaginella moellendorffii]
MVVAMIVFTQNDVQVITKVSNQAIYHFVRYDLTATSGFNCKHDPHQPPKSPTSLYGVHRSRASIHLHARHGHGDDPNREPGAVKNSDADAHSNHDQPGRLAGAIAANPSTAAAAAAATGNHAHHATELPLHWHRRLSSSAAPSGRAAHIDSSASSDPGWSDDPHHQEHYQARDLGAWHAGARVASRRGRRARRKRTMRLKVVIQQQQQQNQTVDYLRPVVDLDEVRRTMVESRATAEEEAEHAKCMARYEHEEAKILAWENHQKAKAEAELRRMEVLCLFISFV